MRPLLLVVLAAAPLARAQTLHEVPPAPGCSQNDALALSVNGSVVVGVSRAVSGEQRAVRWTPAGGTESLGVLEGGAISMATSVSADGTVVVGSSNTTSGFYRAFRWTRETGMQSLGVPAGAVHSGAASVSADGAVVVGTAPVPGPDTHYDRPFRWTSAGGFEMLPMPAGATAGTARLISADRAVIVGDAGVFSGPPYSIFLLVAHRWAGGANASLGALPGGLMSTPYAMSADGAVTVGGSDSSTGYHAYRRTPAGIQDLGLLPGSPTSGRTTAFAVSADGAVVGGGGVSGVRVAAWLWREETGLIELGPYLASLGVDVAGWEFTAVRGISADGTALCGQGRRNGAACGWVVRGLGAPCGADFNGDGFVDFFDYDDFVGCFETGACPSGTSADVNDDGFADFFDYDAFVATFEAGC